MTTMKDLINGTGSGLLNTLSEIARLSE